MISGFIIIFSYAVSECFEDEFRTAMSPVVLNDPQSENARLYSDLAEAVIKRIFQTHISAQQVLYDCRKCINYLIFYYIEKYVHSPLKI